MPDDSAELEGFLAQGARIFACDKATGELLPCAPDGHYVRSLLGQVPYDVILRIVFDPATHWPIRMQWLLERSGYRRAQMWPEPSGRTLCLTVP